MFFKHFSNNFCLDNLLFLPGDLTDVVGGEGAGGEEVVAATALEASDELTHVRRVVVLRRAGRAQLRRPETKEIPDSYCTIKITNCTGLGRWSCT